MDFASVLIKIGQMSPLNLMAIFLKRVNLVLDRSLNGIIRIAVKIIFTGRDLRICLRPIGAYAPVGEKKMTVSLMSVIECYAIASQNSTHIFC